ncbi:MAG: succinate dehydrogenase, hydrophobic membrane anchor protein [Gammaproteobacteria bacterium]|nr:MAG: succinate dehydrogenase, hydrophobic membrane anchor protein [Gammaproteobacteria bacterium]
MSLQTPLRRVLGLGSAREGTGDWLGQRLSAVAIAPLGLWFAFSMLGLEHGQYELVRSWIAEPAHAILLILLLVAVLYHSRLGLRVVIEDYLHGPALLIALVLNQFLHLLAAVSGIFAIVVIAVGSGT